MKLKLATAIATAIALTACDKPPESSAAAGIEFRVDKLFTHDGCTVYRFEDGGRSRYFARCGNQVDTSWYESCGKNCSREVNVTTGGTNDR